MVVKRGTTTPASSDGRALPRHGRDPALHRVHGRGRDGRLAARRRRALRRDRARDRRAPAARARRGPLPRRGRSPLPLPRRPRRDRLDLVRHPAVLPRLHPGPAVGRGQAIHLPVRKPRTRPTGGCCAASSADAELDRRLRGLWRARDDRSPSYAPRAPLPTSPRSRCRTSAAAPPARPPRRRGRATSSSMRTRSRSDAGAAQRVPVARLGRARRCRTRTRPGRGEGGERGSGSAAPFETVRQALHK